MSDKTVNDFLAKRDETFHKVGETAWETPAGAHAVKLLATQKSVTIDDIIASLELEAGTNRGLQVMYAQVILKLRDLQAHRQSD